MEGFYHQQLEQQALASAKRQDAVGAASHHVATTGRELVHTRHQADTTLAEAQQLSSCQAIASHRA